MAAWTFLQNPGRFGRALAPEALHLRIAPEAVDYGQELGLSQELQARHE